MSKWLPVQGSILSTSPCSLEDASILLRRFLDSDTAPDTGLLRGYLNSFSTALEEVLSRRRGKKRHTELQPELENASWQKLETASVSRSNVGESVLDSEVNGVTNGSSLKKKNKVLQQNEHESLQKKRKKGIGGTKGKGTNEECVLRSNNDKPVNSPLPYNPNSSTTSTENDSVRTPSKQQVKAAGSRPRDEEAALNLDRKRISNL